jgi:putative CocE/NonD family hydrolase
MWSQGERTKPRLLLDQRVPMRDGVMLFADVYLLPTGDGPWPAIVQRTPYDNTWDYASGPTIALARHGYAAVLQDVRDRADSEGVWDPFRNEGPDGYDTIAWTGEQPWCDGAVGMMGPSYLGFVQWAAARERPPYLKAMTSTAACGRWWEELPYRFGVFTPYWLWWLNLVAGHTNQLSLAGDSGWPDWPRILTHRPLRDLDRALGRAGTAWRTWLAHSTYDDYWRQLSLSGHFKDIDPPVLHITGWLDDDQWGALHCWDGMLQESLAAERQWLICGPYNHLGTYAPAEQVGGRHFGLDAVIDLHGLYLRFFDRWLKGVPNGAERDRRVRIFTMGRNAWRDEDRWPPVAAVAMDFYLHSGGRANTAGGDGLLSRSVPGADQWPDRYTYDPDDPTPSFPDLDGYPFADYPLDNSWRLRRDDVLVYTSDPLEGDLEITGHPFLVLQAASDCPDTDWHVALSDVWPDGRSDQVTAGRLRAAHRAGLAAAPSPIEPGRIYAYRVEFLATSNLWPSGHRLRVTVASANIPESARNPNTNAPIGDDAEVRIAHNAVYHTAHYPSRLIAPVIPNA